MDYCDIEQLTGREAEGETPALAGYLPSVTSDQDKAKLAEIITRSSRRIDAYVTDGQVVDYFAPSPSEPTARTIRGEGVSYLGLPEFVPASITTVTAPAGYTAPNYEEEGSTLVIVDDAGRRTRFSIWIDGLPYTVTARWGIAAIPGDITEACLQLSVRTYRKVDEGFSGVIGDIQTASGIIERPLPTGVKEILDVHRRKYLSRRLTIA